MGRGGGERTRPVKNPPYVHGFTDRHGKTRWYFRRSGFKRSTLPGLPWSPEFMAAHEAAMNSAPEPIGASRTQPGTVNAVVIAYFQNQLWTENLAPGTQAIRRPILERFREDHGDKRIAKLGAAHIAAMLDKRPTYHAKRNWLRAVRGLMAFCVEARHIAADPSTGIKVKRPRRRSGGHMTWKDGQIARYRAHHQLGTMARVAIELLLNVASRRQDACVLGRQHERAGKLSWRPAKTLHSTGKLLTIRIIPELRAALDAMPASDTLTYLTTDYGKPFASAAAFGNKFADWCREAGLEAVTCDDGRTRNYRAHGLRKAACCQLAHSGCTAAEIQAVSGHATLAQLQVYIDEVEQERMADVAIKKRQTNADRGT